MSNARQISPQRQQQNDQRNSKGTLRQKVNLIDIWSFDFRHWTLDIWHLTLNTQHSIFDIQNVAPVTSIVSMHRVKIWKSCCCGFIIVHRRYELLLELKRTTTKKTMTKKKIGAHLCMRPKSSATIFPDENPISCYFATDISDWEDNINQTLRNLQCLLSSIKGSDVVLFESNIDGKEKIKIVEVGRNSKIGQSWIYCRD